jgi:hypothetical protein
MGTRLAGINRDMNTDQFCTDAITVCALASTSHIRSPSCILGLSGDRLHRSFECRITFRLHQGRDLQNHQSATEPAVRCRGCFRSTASRLAFGSGDWTIEMIGQRPLPIVNLPRCQRRKSTQRLC